MKFFEVSPPPLESNLRGVVLTIRGVDTFLTLSEARELGNALLNRGKFPAAYDAHEQDLAKVLTAEEVRSWHDEHLSRWTVETVMRLDGYGYKTASDQVILNCRILKAECKARGLNNSPYY